MVGIVAWYGASAVPSNVLSGEPCFLWVRVKILLDLIDPIY